MNYPLCFAFILFLLISAYSAPAQENPNDKQLLARQPNFLKTHLKTTDSLFIQDVAVLKKFIVFDNVDTALLKPRILYAVLRESNIDIAATYQTLVDALRTFKQGIGYIEFRKGIILYRQMATIKVNPANWEKDQELFRKLGFTEADLEDFFLFIAKPENKNLNYKEAYLAYMKEIDSLP